MPPIVTHENALLIGFVPRSRELRATASREDLIQLDRLPTTREAVPVHGRAGLKPPRSHHEVG